MGFSGWEEEVLHECAVSFGGVADMGNVLKTWEEVGGGEFIVLLK